MLRVAEGSFARSDTGRQRRANEDSYMAQAPVFVVADGMGGARAGEVASRLAVESYEGGLPQSEATPEQRLADQARQANARIHELSRSESDLHGMGTTLTAVYVGEDEVSIAHVGDSRAYCLRDGELLRLTDDHSLVDELMRQGRLTPEEAVEHPQRSIITRALGPEPDVAVDTRTFRTRPGDVYLLCSDGLTSMIDERTVAEILRSNADLQRAGQALIRRPTRPAATTTSRSSCSRWRRWAASRWRTPPRSPISQRSSHGPLDGRRRSGRSGGAGTFARAAVPGPSVQPHARPRAARPPPSSAPGSQSRSSRCSPSWASSERPATSRARPCTSSARIRKAW